MPLPLCGDETTGVALFSGRLPHPADLAGDDQCDLDELLMKIQVHQRSMRFTQGVAALGKSAGGALLKTRQIAVIGGRLALFLHE
jgi:hypothetical protein